MNQTYILLPEEDLSPDVGIQDGLDCRRVVASNLSEG